jgi:uncharacterized protein (DUF427 family)
MKVNRDTTMMKATWNGQTIAESDKTIEMDGFVYFPEETVKREFLRTSSTTAASTILNLFTVNKLQDPGKN